MYLPRDSKEEMLDEIKSVIFNFLRENGGYDNGFATYVKGKVEPCNPHSLEWETPTSRQLTKDEIKKKGFELNRALTKCLKNYFNVIIIDSEYEEYGSYCMEITIGRSVLLHGLH